MEVGPVKNEVGTKPTVSARQIKPDPVSQALDSVVRRLAKVEKLMKQSVVAPPGQPPPRRQQYATPYGRGQMPRLGKPAWNADGTPYCFRCGQRGHMGKVCPQFGDNVTKTSHSKNLNVPLPVNASGSA